MQSGSHRNTPLDIEISEQNFAELKHDTLGWPNKE
jgi:hypothetical protein